MRYRYSFTVWPSETWGFEREFFLLFEVLSSRIELVFSQEEFEAFRSALNRHGLTLREVERVRYAEPEQVY